MDQQARRRMYFSGVVVSNLGSVIASWNAPWQQVLIIHAFVTIFALFCAALYLHDIPIVFRYIGKKVLAIGNGGAAGLLGLLVGGFVGRGIQGVSDTPTAIVSAIAVTIVAGGVFYAILNSINPEP